MSRGPMQRIGAFPAALGAIAAILVFGFAIAGAAGSPPRPKASRPQRIVSLNLCADQLVLALADRSQIAGLTRNAKDRDMSAAADEVGDIRMLSQSAEEILAIGPDMVIGMPAGRRSVMAALSGQHYRMVDLDSAESYADIVRQVREVAKAVGHPERGEALIARMDRKLAALPRPGGGALAAYYQRRGYLTGTGTLVDDLMQRVGLTNLATQLGKPVLSRMSLEEMVAARPDYLIVESATNRVTDQGTEMLHHPALRGMKRLSIPQAWTVCGGPAYVLAARSLSQQLARDEGRKQEGRISTR